MTKVLDEPVHLALLKPTHLSSIRKQLQPSPVSLEEPPPPKTKKHLPVISRVPKTSIQSPMKVIATRRRMEAAWEQAVELMPKDQPEPPCKTCKTSPCCRAFVVELSADEYNSGLYSEYAVKITPEVRQQLASNARVPQLQAVSNPLLAAQDETSYLLEGPAGDPCPFLSDRGCTIYADRPMVCRVYSCVGDERITQALRDGDA